MIPKLHASGNTQLKEFVRAEASVLGFDLVGFARAGEPAEESRRFRTWLGRGHHGSMSWMERNGDRRMDPGKVLPGVRTIVSVGVNYYSSHHHDGRPGTGKISRYAWGDDYHEIIRDRLKDLLARIVSTDSTINGKIYVDTGPVLEKAWAQRAGIGWQGKHTNIISREYGSWIFLGEIFLTAEIDPDAPETDQCGQCTLCLEACPTGAIVEPYVLDATRCISYLTIEHGGAIDGEFTGLMDGWLYGCDVCQDVCPWNDRPVETHCDSFTPREGNVNRDLLEVLEMPPREFSRIFRKSPVKRAGHSGLVRNAKLLLGGTGTGENNGKDDE